MLNGSSMPNSTGREPAIGWTPAPFDGGYLSQREFQHRRDMTTATELAKCAFSNADDDVQ